MVDRIFQILITDGQVDESKFSEELVRNISSFRSMYPDARYNRYENQEIIEFLSQCFSDDVLAAYQGMAPYAFKSDLARYCYLYEYGGLYSDLSYLHIRKIKPQKKTNMILFRDIPIHPPWATSISVMFAKPKSPALARAISRIVEHHKSQYYGLTPLDPTGPYMFGRVLSEVDDWMSTVFGDSRLLSREQGGRPNIAKVLPTGEIIAIRNKFNDSSIDEMIGGHSNNYSDIWHAKQVWGEAGKITKIASKFGAIFGR
ncbi:MAG: glycosyltransferase [Paracoccaceae bacterium]